MPARPLETAIVPAAMPGPVMVIDGRILGFSAADTRDGTIFALFIDPAHEGRGIGRALFAKALDSLRAAGHREGSLTTQPGSRADRFYQRAGWKVIGTSERGERIFHGML